MLKFIYKVQTKVRKHTNNRFTGTDKAKIVQRVSLFKQLFTITQKRKSMPELVFAIQIVIAWYCFSLKKKQESPSSISVSFDFRVP